MRVISFLVGRYLYVVLFGEKNGILYGMGEDCFVGYVDELG